MNLGVTVFIFYVWSGKLADDMKMVLPFSQSR